METFEKDEGILLKMRKKIMEHIQRNEDCRDSLHRLIHATISTFSGKYAILNVENLLHMNNQGVQNLFHIVHGLSWIIKYSLVLLKPIQQRRRTWNIFPFKHHLIKNGITPLVGYDTILNQLGYTSHCLQGLTFAPGTEPNLSNVGNMIVDMMLFQMEIKEFLRGTHPLAIELNSFLPDHTVAEILHFQMTRNVADSSSDDLSSSDENPFSEEDDEVVMRLEQQSNRLTPSNQPTANVEETLSDLCIGERDINTNKMLSSPGLPEDMSGTSVVSSKGSHPSSGFIACDVCGAEARVFCRDCAKKPFCGTCSDSFHKHPNRRGHEVETITNLSNVSLDSQPVVQVEGMYGIMAPQQSQQSLRLNKSQETEVVKSPSRWKNPSNNVPLFDLLGINSAEEGHLEHSHPLNEAHQRRESAVHVPLDTQAQYERIFDESMLSRQHAYGINFPHLGQTPPHPYGSAHSVSTSTTPAYTMTPSLTQQGGMTLGGPNHRLASLYTNAQMNYNMSKQLGANLSPPGTHLEPGYFNHPAQGQFQGLPQGTAAPTYSPHNHGLIHGPPFMTTDPKQPSMPIAPHDVPMSVHTQGLYSTVNMAHPPYLSSSGQNTSNILHGTAPGPYTLTPFVPKDMMNYSQSREGSPDNHYYKLPSQGGSNVPHKPSYMPGLLSQNPDPPADRSSMLSANLVIPLRLKNIMTIPNNQIQQKKCQDAIGDLNATIVNLSLQIDDKLRTKDFDKTFEQLDRQKCACLIERDSIANYLKRISSEASGDNVPETLDSKAIRFPPPLTPFLGQTTSMSGKDLKRSSHAHNVEKRGSVEEKPLNVPVDTYQEVVCTVESHVPIKNQDGEDVLPQRFKQPRVPVESTNIVEGPHSQPPLSPRQEKNTEDLGDVLTRILQPPGPSQCQTGTKNMKWQCQYCTLLNDVTSHICDACGKTTESPELLNMYSNFAEGYGNSETSESPLEPVVGNIAQAASTASIGSRIIEHQQKSYQVLKEKKKAQEEFASASERNRLIHTSKRNSLVEQKTSTEKTALGEGNNAPKKQNSLRLHQQHEETTSIPDAQKALAWRMEIERNELLIKEGRELMFLVKAADLKGYKGEAVSIAQTFCEAQNLTPLQWLDEHWKRNLENIAYRVTMAGNDEAQKCVGELTLEEAETAFISCNGSVNEAIQLAIKTRKEQLNALCAVGDFSREDVLRVLKLHGGNVTEAEVALINAKFEPCLTRMWDTIGPCINTMYANRQREYANNLYTCESFEKFMRNKDIAKERRIRMILVEGKLRSWGRANLVIEILDKEAANLDVTLEDVIECVRNCRDRQHALSYLQQECLICYESFPMSKIRSLNFCQCKMCQDCLTKNFKMVIHEKHIINWSCPLCSMPDINDDEMATDYLGFLSLLLRELIDPDSMDLFDTRIRDYHLHKDPNFRWCAHCAVGFLAENPQQLSMTCFNCHKKTCFKCKRQWEPQHENLTCEEFSMWKVENDPANQAVGLAKHLEDNGIDCPSCKMRFALAKGGCMHFRCPECGHEFCSGCNKTYFKPGVCTKYESCKTQGFHCHHPRDCFSYLRDRSATELQSLLQHNLVNFNVKTPDDQEDAAHCPVMEQKDNGDAKKDEKCGKDSAKGHAGLCESHYKEYLTGIINRHQLDPLFLMDIKDMENLLKRHCVKIPEKVANENDEDYKIRLIKIIKQKLPLERN